MVSALYLHIPFCARKCAYCDFPSWATPAADPLMAAYARALEAQLAEAAALGLVEGCETAYVGGGTPTLLGEKDLRSLVSAVRSAAPGVTELSCEANPDSLADGVIDALRAAGATRLSVGVQSLDDGELAELGRLHDAACARDRVAAAVGSGLDVSVDLMCATPGQTDGSWQRTLEGALALGVGHVSVYPLQIEEGTALDRRYADDPCPWNSDDALAHRPARKLGIPSQIGSYAVDNLLIVALVGPKAAGAKQEHALIVQGGEQRRDRRRARALVAPKTDEHRVGRAGALRLERNLICIRIVAQRRGMDKLNTRSLQSALDRARNHPGITALAVNHQRARHSHVASFPPKLKPLMQFIR